MSIGFVAEKKVGTAQFNPTISQRDADAINRWLDRAHLAKNVGLVAAFRLLRHAPVELKDLAVTGDEAGVKAWLHRAHQAQLDNEAVETVKRMLEQLAGSQGGGRRSEGGGSGQ